MKALMMTGLALATASAAWGWEGTDAYTGASIEIGQGELVRSGESIDVDVNGFTKSFTVEDVDAYGYAGTTIEATDDQTGELRTFEME